MILALVCPVVILINLSDEPWNDRDRRELNTSKKRCVLIKPDKPCLVKFVKKGKLWYRGICGYPAEDRAQCVTDL